MSVPSNDSKIIHLSRLSVPARKWRRGSDGVICENLVRILIKQAPPQIKFLHSLLVVLRERHAQVTDPVVKVADGAVHRQSPTRMFLPCGDVYGVDTVSNEIYSVDIGNCVGGEAVSYNDTLPAGRQNNVHRQLVELSGGIAQMGRDDFGGSQRDCLVDVRRQGPSENFV